MNKLLSLLIVFLFSFAMMGCSGNRQFVDPSWTQKPSSVKVVIANPLSYWIPKIVPEMDPMSDWFKDKVDNTFKFNTKLSYVVENIPKEQVTHVAEDMDGKNIQVPKLETMSDSFEVYLILDNVRMWLSDTSSTMDVTSPTVAQNYGPGFNVLTFKGENTKASANYAVYETKTGKRLAYGFLEESIFHEDVAVEHGWFETVRQLVMHVIELTPISQF